MKYTTTSHSKYSLKCHVVLVVKYRKKLLINFGEFVKQMFYDISINSDFKFDIMEVDKNHIHLLIDYKPTITVKSIINRLKSVSTKKLWQQHQEVLKSHFWKEHTFWSSGYFVCSVGDASIETIRKYIEEQG